MSYLGAALVVIASASASALAAWAARRLIRLEIRRRHHEIGSAVFLQLGVIFAVLLAFVFNEVWSEYTSAAQAISAECSDLRASAAIASTLPPGRRGPILQAITNYLEEVIGNEWPAMGRRAESAAAVGAFRALLMTAARPAPDTAGAPTAELVTGQLLTMLDRVHQERNNRLFQMTLGVPDVLWWLLVAISTILVGFVAFCGLEYIVSQAGFAALLGGALAAMLVVIDLLDFPFEGALRLPPEQFQQALSMVLRISGHS